MGCLLGFFLLIIVPLIIMVKVFLVAFTVGVVAIMAALNALIGKK
jgi:hypothetical protein